MTELLTSAPAGAGVKVRSLHGIEALQRADRLLREVWGTRRGDDPPIALDLLCAFSHTGGYVGGAFLGGELVGVAAGFLAAGRSLHSHITGVAAGARGCGVGRALKEHQRAWAAEHGLVAVSWTFDPLLRRNAFFNLTRLGARVVGYLPDFYGPMSDGINDGGPSDRLFVTWPTEAAASPPVSDHDGVVVVDETGAVQEAGDAPLLRCATPADVESLRATDPAAARRWRAALESGLGGALDRGYRVTGFTRSGWYVLAHGGAA
ncbi:putative GNAT superfamily acetyltransferase [Streptosporangium becharense]|uniref:Putative GNAT superfamily acetyltransferase n=1 Tax=Streptosporangium becharense TaxID=1816182 RepID=A0A7W9IC39_9ACTN|nr:GNAT family N-acetyltransferase [Streptosporangium becharense]MBB2910708.1 putative GNAT superfamily acetyltransferase [Streptosporangium becharense]MBB5817403.1 putative GNAT superfamily acetyltransferase [Streptosporangium becharense]